MSVPQEDVEGGIWTTVALRSFPKIKYAKEVKDGRGSKED